MQYCPAKSCKMSDIVLHIQIPYVSCIATVLVSIDMLIHNTGRVNTVSYD